MANKVQTALNKFDDYNENDPNIFVWHHASYPQELFLADKLYDWVNKLAPTRSTALTLASKSQHIGRWEIPRSSFAMDKNGYLNWRKELALHHASTTRDILVNLDFSDELISQVEQIILKKKIKGNPDVQTMENALCLVFLEFQYEKFYPKHEEKIVNILKKSLLKMDKVGHKFALQLPYSETGLKYIEAALSELTKKNNR
ncbi:MAG: DUF4202 domain-containing protein [Sphingobacterium sp.]